MTGGHLLHIPRWHPAKANQLLSGHWSNGHRLKKADREMVAGYAAKATTPKATGKRRVTLTILLKPKQRGADPDAYWKSTLDALVQAGLLIDDNRQHVELSPVQYRRESAEAWGTSIYLENLDSPGRD